MQVTSCNNTTCMLYDLTLLSPITVPHKFIKRSAHHDVATLPLQHLI
jgi:hypothetical protein